MITELKKAAKIAKGAFLVAEKLLKPEIDLLELAEKVEEYIIDKGGAPAFPVNISINHIAAHFTPQKPGYSLREGDIVKIDLGVHIDGWIVDTARTYEINDTKYKKLIDATRSALESAVKYFKKGVKISEIGKIIEDTIVSFGYKPIYNLSGHKIERYILHAGLNIPNYDNRSQKTINSGIYAIEPFATTGVGYVKDGEPSGIYSFINEPRIRIPTIKRFAEELYNKYKMLPFAKRWVVKEFGNKYNVDLALNYLVKAGILYEYPVLIEQSKGIVAQWETTVLVDTRVVDLMSEE